MTFDPNQERDDKGQWAAGSGDGIKRPAERGVKKLSGSPTQLAKHLEAKYPGTVVELRDNTGRDAYGRKLWQLDSIVVPKDSRGQGTGSAVMREIVAEADRHGATVTLLPSTDFGATSVDRLRRFYSQFGFRRNFGARSDPSLPMGMFREPTKRK